MNKADRAVRVAAAALAMLALAAGDALATPLVYVPVNPAFGGNPLIGTTLLSTAQATNKHKDSASGPGSSLGKTPLQQFSDMLERSILGQLSAAATSGVIADGKLKPGTVETGDFRIEIVDAGGGLLTITTTDKVTGQSTSFQVGGN